MASRCHRIVKTLVGFATLLCAHLNLSEDEKSYSEQNYPHLDTVRISFTTSVLSLWLSQCEQK